MGKITTKLLGLIKDKASLSKVTLFSHPNTLNLHIAVLRATTHSPSIDPYNISRILAVGEASRATASVLITIVIDRLRRTGDSSVALKCLITLHHILVRGPFILQDQLSVFPNSGGRNYLNMSAFHDGACANTWALSNWVRWYARYVETVLSSSRILGFFVVSKSIERKKMGVSVSCIMNYDLIQDLEALISVIEEICKLPDSLFIEGNPLQFEIVELLGTDYLSILDEISIRIDEFKLRLSCLSFTDSVELLCLLKRLEDCKAKLRVLFSVEKPFSGNLWSSSKELKGLIGDLRVFKEDDVLMNLGEKKGSESARFGERVLKSDSVQFSSARFGLSDKFSSFDIRIAD